MDINKKIMDMCFQRGWTLYTLSLEAGITQSTLQSMMNRGNAPKIETLQAICEAFGITLSQFFLENEQVEILSENEVELIESFRRLTPEKQQALLKFIDK